MAVSKKNHSKKHESEPEREDQDESEAYESKADDESDDGVSAGTEKDTDTDTDTDYAEVKEAETDRSSSDEESVKKSRIRQRRGTSFRRGRSFSSDSEDDFSDDSLSYDSDDSDISSSGLGRCCSCAGTILKEAMDKTMRNLKVIRRVSLRVVRAIVVVLRSEELRSFTVNVLVFLAFMFRFVWSLLVDLKSFIVRKLEALWRTIVAVAVIAAKYAFVALGFSLKEGYKLSLIGFREGKKQVVSTARNTRSAAIFCVRSPYLLGKTIVNAPWILYRAFLENTNLLVPMLYGFIGWCIVLFLYVPIFAYILHCLDVLTVDDLDALGLKGLCITLGLIPEEKKTSLDVIRKVWRQIFY